ncbi:tRNA (adenosine(37)-N6)-dimethylallyltransferase MiaA [Rickettsiales bacterium]|nr:tRNA (adenosine(37)-N6)-dimethylallyltransferase MiaA [Rickettsiales bacterium]
MPKKPIIIISGPTASGKTAISIEVAKHYGNFEIINCDSKQFYKEMPIITAQPTKQERGDIPHHLFGVLSMKDSCSVTDWLDMALPIIKDVQKRGKVPLIVGGTGMYIKSLMHGLSPIPDIDPDIRRKVREMSLSQGSQAVYEKLKELDPQTAAKLNPGDSQRVSRAYEVILQTGKSLSYWHSLENKMPYPEAEFLLFFVTPNRDWVYQRCNERFDQMIKQGVIEEIAALGDEDFDNELPSVRSHGVREMKAYINGQVSLEEAIKQSQTNTRKYVKRQFTWFNNQMDEAITINPMPGNDYKTQLFDKIDRFLLT